MPETPEPRPAEAAGADRALLIVIASDPAAMDDLLTALLDFGVTGATLVESKGMAAVLREEMPIFAGLMALLPGSTGSRMLFSVTTHETAQRVLDYIDNELRDDTSTIAVVLPAAQVSGLKR